MTRHENLSLDHQLCFPLYAATRSITQAYNRELKPLGLTYPQFLILLVLWEEDGASIKEIGQKLALDSGTLSPLIKKMENAGIVKRERGDVDERVLCVSLTRKGKDLEDKVAPVQHKVECATGLSEAQFIELRTALNSLRKCLNRSG